MFGPRSAGSSLILLMREAHRRLAGSSALRVKEAPGAATRALAAAAQAAGAEIRTSTPVEQIVVRGNARARDCGRRPDRQHRCRRLRSGPEDDVPLG